MKKLLPRPNEANNLKVHICKTQGERKLDIKKYNKVMRGIHIKNRH